jgi:hypothetical protein
MSDDTERKLPAKDWERFFRQAGLLTDKPNSPMSRQACSIKIGLFLSPMVGREVPVEVNGRTGRATLRMKDVGRAKGKLYYLEVVWDDSVAAATPPARKGRTAREKRSPKPSPGKKGTRPAPSPAADKRSHGKAKPSRGQRRGNDEAW